VYIHVFLYSVHRLLYSSLCECGVVGVVWVARKETFNAVVDCRVRRCCCLLLFVVVCCCVCKKTVHSYFNALFICSVDNCCIRIGSIIMESQLTVEEIANLFRAADEDGSGFLSPLEIASIMTQLNGGVTPSEGEVASCLRAMDSNEDGQISEEEFLNAMLTWLKMVKTPGKRQLDAAESPVFSRKKTLNDMANFFRQFSTIPNFAAEQNRILTSRRKEIDMAAVHREYAMPTADEKAEAYESIKAILADGKVEIMKEIHSLDWNVVLVGVAKVNALLSVVEMFQSPDER
jgi:hypothetical protein